ncbi:integrase catalytic domain-containing protein [Trichonephila clavipes]|uniref:Integrase catalytic domain-containing protein n=1 Tax=Trichonephila clavipes TaxID=2585209 RepID=A0A8X6WK63_TRICX|nr:integrase catalytic domain-containing protein [Trichonephila clavipes]
MPHHGVYRPEKSTTKMRTVFNASSPSTSGKSLNSIQFNGGLVQEDLFSIMVRFRKHKYAFTTDIEKMFRMINIHPEQTCLQKNSVEEGHRRANKNVRVNYSNLRHTAPVVLSDCYMDDILSGSEYRRGNRIAASINRNVQDRRGCIFISGVEIYPR